MSTAQVVSNVRTCDCGRKIQSRESSSCLKCELSHATGCETYYKAPFGRLIYTQGVKHLADEAGAYWLIDLIASHQGRKLDKCDGFQVWKLVKLPETAKNDAKAICARDWCKNGKPIDVACQQLIPFTDFPFDTLDDEFKLYAVWNGYTHTLMLPSEY